MADTRATGPIHYANSLAIRFGDNDVACTFGIELEPGNADSSVPQATVVMTPRTAKILAQNLSAIINRFERDMGRIAAPDAIDIDSIMTKRS